jgi:MscS family membrane protein
LVEFAENAHNMEENGITEGEKKQLEQDFSRVITVFGLKETKEPKGWLSRAKPKLEINDINDDSLIKLVILWTNDWLKDPDLIREDRTSLPAEWEQKISYLRIKLERLYRYVFIQTGHERRLDYEAYKIISWISTDFKELDAEEKYPDIRLVNFGASSLDFEVSFYVDNIKLEHYERADRIKDELRREIKYRFDAAGIEIPFPQTDIWFRSALEARKSKK